MFRTAITIHPGLLGAPEAEFPRLAAAFRAELAPRDLLEGLQVDLALMALAMLRRALATLERVGPDDVKAMRAHASAHKMLTQALREFGRLRKRTPAAPALSAETPAPKPAEPAARPAPAPSAPIARAARPAPTGRPRAAAAIPSAFVDVTAGHRRPAPPTLGGPPASARPLATLAG